MTDFPDLTVFISRDHGELVTDSRAVALAFVKRHTHVMRTVHSMFRSEYPEIVSHAETNFGLCSFRGENGKEEAMFRMTEKGLSELAMSFTGDKSRVMRIRFLNAFEEMATRLALREKTITAQLLELERREMPSKIKGQVGSHLMNERRKEKPSFAEERALLEAIAQPSLLPH